MTSQTRQAGSAATSRAPLTFRLATHLRRRKLPGAYRLLDVTRRLGMLDRVVRYPIADGVTLDVPISRPENAWSRADVFRYQRAMMSDLVSTIHEMSAPVTFVDCGADIGLVSVMVVARCGDRVDTVVAVEPNDAAYRLLEVNLARLPCRTSAYKAAVSATRGRGTLATAAYDSSDHARYLVAGDAGDVDVVRVDDLPITRKRPVVLKLDVEGAEDDAVRGAEQILMDAPEFAVSFEAHSVVSKRTGVDPIETIRFLNSLRPCSVRTSEFPHIELSMGRPFFPQVPDRGGRALTILCRSLPRAQQPS